MDDPIGLNENFMFPINQFAKYRLLGKLWLTKLSFVCLAQWFLMVNCQTSSNYPSRDTELKSYEHRKIFITLSLKLCPEPILTISGWQGWKAGLSRQPWWYQRLLSPGLGGSREQKTCLGRKIHLLQARMLLLFLSQIWSQPHKQESRKMKYHSTILGWAEESDLFMLTIFPIFTVFIYFWIMRHTLLSANSPGRRTPISLLRRRCSKLSLSQTEMNLFMGGN